MKPTCPKCNEPLFYVQRIYEYLSIESIAPDDMTGDTIELLSVEDDFIDGEYPPRLRCKACDIPYDFDNWRKAS